MYKLASFLEVARIQKNKSLLKILINPSMLIKHKYELKEIKRDKRKIKSKKFRTTENSPMYVYINPH